MRLKNIDLFLIIVLSALMLEWALLPDRPLVLGIILAFPMVFIVPGYALTELLFHKKQLHISYRIICTLSLSIILCILGGYILNFFPAGLQLLSWTILLTSLTILFSLITMYLRYRYRVIRTLAHQAGRTALNMRIPAYQYLFFLLTFGVVTFSILYAVNGVGQQPHPGFTQLWLLPRTPNGQSCMVQLGVRNFENRPTTYRVAMTVDGTPLTTWSSITLLPTQEWTRMIPVTSKGTTHPYLKLQLFRADQPQVEYREAHVTLNGCNTP